MIAPVAGFASAATSFCVRFVQAPVKPTSTSCQDGLARNFEQPDAVPPFASDTEPQTVSVQPRPLLACLSVVPPTEVTYWKAAGNVGPYPRSPDAKSMTSPGWLKYRVKAFSRANSRLPQELETYLAPLATAVSSAFARFASPEFVASISVMWHLGQIAETMSRSSDSSTPQRRFVGGSGPFLPFWLSMRRQPLEVVHGGRWKCARYTFRSAARCGLLKASTIATSRPLPPLGEIFVSL